MFCPHRVKILIGPYYGIKKITAFGFLKKETALRFEFVLSFGKTNKKSALDNLKLHWLISSAVILESQLDTKQGSIGSSEGSCIKYLTATVICDFREK